MVWPLILGLMMMAGGAGLTAWYASMDEDEKRDVDNEFRAFVRKKVGMEDYESLSEAKQKSLIREFAKSKGVTIDA